MIFFTPYFRHVLKTYSRLILRSSDLTLVCNRLTNSSRVLRVISIFSMASQIQDSPASAAQPSPPSDTLTSVEALSTQVDENDKTSDTETVEEIGAQTKKLNRKSSEVNAHFKLVTKRKNKNNLIIKFFNF